MRIHYKDCEEIEAIRRFRLQISLGWIKVNLRLFLMESLLTKSYLRVILYKYLVCLIDRVKRFNIVGKQAMSYIEKQYAVDTGFRMINTNLVNFEDTFFLENIIYNELKARDEVLMLTYFHKRLFQY